MTRTSPLRRLHSECSTNTWRQKRMTSTAESTSDSAPPAMPQAPPYPQAPRTSESPLSEMGRRLADQFPIWPAAHAVGLQNTRDIWADAKLKRKMDRLVQARAMGVEDALADGNEEVPGDINIQGDTVVQHYYNAPQASPSTTATSATTADTTTTPAKTPMAPDAATGTATAPVASSPTPTIRERVRTRAVSLIGPVLLGAALPMAGAAGMALYHYITDKPESVSVTQPAGQSQFEYRYGIDQRPTPK